MHNYCRNSLWTPIVYCLTYIIFDKRKKIGQIPIFTGKIAFVFKYMVLPQPLRCYRIDLMTSIVIVRILFGPLWIIFWGFFFWILRKKAKFFSSLERLLLFFSKVYVFNNLLGPDEMILDLQQWLSKKFVDPCFVTVRAAFFWSVCYYRPFRSQRKDLIVCTTNVKKPCGPL